MNRVPANGTDRVLLLDSVKTPLSRPMPVTNYAAGFPCQPYSPEGVGGGLKDHHSRGQELFDAMLARLKFLACNSFPGSFSHGRQSGGNVCVSFLNFLILGCREFGVRVSRQHDHNRGLKRCCWRILRD